LLVPGSKNCTRCSQEVWFWWNQISVIRTQFYMNFVRSKLKVFWYCAPRSCCYCDCLFYSYLHLY